MAIYSTFFLCKPHHLLSAFPGWKLPLEVPVTRTTLNPFTREEITIETREPEWSEVDPNVAELPDIGVVSIEGDYDSCLEQRIPSFIQSQPHWCAKGITGLELEPLVAAVTGEDEQELETPLYSPPSMSSALDILPQEFVIRLKSADDSRLTTIARQWAAEMSTPEFTHSVSGERLENDMTLEEALSLLSPIAELAKQHQNDDFMYLLIE